MFPSCSEPGLEIVRSLIGQPGLDVVGGSSLLPSHDPSSLILKHHVSLPWLTSDGFYDSLLEVLHEYRINIIFPATDNLIAELSRAALKDFIIIAPRSEIAAICMSKSKTYKQLMRLVPTPQIYRMDESVEFPAYAKPHEEAGGRGHMQVHDADELKIARQRGLLITEFLPGDEYEVNCLSDLQGRLLYSNIRRMGRRVGGHVLDSQAINDSAMSGYVEEIGAKLRIEGPWFAQFKRNRSGEPVLIEVNTRIGGGSGLNRFCGVNIPLLAVRLFMGQPISKPILTQHAAVTRCLQFYPNVDPIQSVVWKCNTLIRNDGKVNPHVMACLFDLRNRDIQQHLLYPADLEIQRFLEKRKIPGFFDQIIPYLNRQPQDYIDKLKKLACKPYEQHLFVTDDLELSIGEIKRQFPGMRVATPHSLELLGLEGCS